MSWSIAWALLGCGCVLAAALIVVSVKSAELGEYSARFVAVLVALGAYYGAVSVFHLHADTSPLADSRWVRYALPGLALAALLYFVWKIARNWQYEVSSIVRIGLKFLLIALLAALARFFLLL